MKGIILLALILLTLIKQNSILIVHCFIKQNEQHFLWNVKLLLIYFFHWSDLCTLKSFSKMNLLQIRL
jgi:hypothetical protein